MTHAISDHRPMECLFQQFGGAELQKKLNAT